MGLIKCHECGQQISSKAATCPHCGAKKKKPSAALGCLVFVGLLFLLAALVPEGDPPKPLSPEEQAAKDAEAEAAREEFDRELNKRMAASTAQDYVKRSLKSPRSAKFPGLFSGVDIADHVTIIDGIYIVTSYVDADNSFGANIRTNYICKLRMAGKNNFELVDLKIIE